MRKPSLLAHCERFFWFIDFMDNHQVSGSYDGIYEKGFCALEYYFKKRNIAHSSKAICLSGSHTYQLIFQYLNFKPSSWGVEILLS